MSGSRELIAQMRYHLTEAVAVAAGIDLDLTREARASLYDLIDSLDFIEAALAARADPA